MLNMSLFEKTSDPAKVRFWFFLSLIPTLYFGLFSLFHAFSREYVIQDDARQHIVWMQRFIDPDLFPNDLLLDYFQSISTIGNRTLYYWFSQLGIEPLLLAKFMPIGIGLVSAIYGFWLAFQILPIPISAFIGTTILTQTLWLEDDIISGGPRGFLYPLLLAFLYYLIKPSVIPCLVAIALQAAFYPQVAMVEVGILTFRLVDWQNGKITLSNKKIDYLLWLLGTVLVIGLLLVFSRDVSAFGSLITLEQMQGMPEFLPGGRAKFFEPDPFKYWFTGNSGISPVFNLPIVWFSVLLPVLLKRHALAQFISAKVRILLDVTIPSLVIFSLAHLVFTKLYLPDRYTTHTLRVVMSIAAGIVVTMMLHSIGRQMQRQGWGALKRSQQLIISGFLLFLTASAIVPAIPSIFLGTQSQVLGREPEIYEFFAQQPKDSMVASLSFEADNIPAFSQRSVLVSWEYAYPYHVGYYDQIRQRVTDLMQAQYSPRLRDVKQVIEQYGIDFFLVERKAFTPDYIRTSRWLRQYKPQAEDAIAHLQGPRKPALARLMRRCSTFETENFVVLDATCIAGVGTR